MLKSSLLALTLAGLLYAVTPLANAQYGSNDQQAAPAGEASEHGPGHHGFDPAKRTEMLTRHLNLTSDQQAKVQDILKSEQTQMEKLHSDSSISKEDRRSKMMDIHKASDDQIRELLDANQQKKFDAMQAKREQWMQNHHHGQAPGAPPESEQK
jgi:Spy/CpxP family protein refolding chaperone